MSRPVGAKDSAVDRPVVEGLADCVVAGGFAVEFDESNAFDAPKPMPPAMSASAITAPVARRPRGRLGGAGGAAPGGGGIDGAVSG